MTTPEPQDAAPAKKSRRGRGEDAIYFDKSKGCYVGAVSLGYSATGKRRRPKVYGKTKSEVKDKLRALRKELETGVKPDARYTVAEAVSDWLAKGLKGRSKKTVEKYRILASTHIISAIGRTRLAELTADDVDDWLETLTTTLASSSIKTVHGILRRSITQAQRRDKVGRPSKALTFEQATAVLTAASTTRLHAYVVLSLLVGVRTEEARAVRWEHVELERKDDVPPHVMVWRSVREHGDTKTRKSWTPGTCAGPSASSCGTQGYPRTAGRRARCGTASSP
jgi:hypothetical protein